MSASIAYFVAKLHEIAPHRVLNFRKILGVTPTDPHTLGSVPGPRERKGGVDFGGRGIGVG